MGRIKKRSLEKKIRFRLMKSIIYFANGGSGNHGCEAIIRSIEQILKPESKSLSLTPSIDEDIFYGLNDIVELISLSDVKHNNIEYLKSYLQLKIGRSKFALDIFPYRQILHQISSNKKCYALSVGGDNYCYGGTDFYEELDRTFHKSDIKTAMIGCSIEPAVIENKNVQRDLLSHEIIIARESLTYKALIDNGIINARLLPDPAFVLNTKLKDLPEGFVTNNTVGINLSPQVNKCSIDGNIVSQSVDKLIESIIVESDMQVALIPHVVWPQSNDMDTLLPLYNKFKETGRVILINDCNAEELKGYISRCRFLIAARTHASIAAYSSCVPTLVIGYSVKAKGIAKDIFGTYDNYVLPAQSFTNDRDLIHGFEWLKEHEDSIRQHLQSFMPDYCKKAYQIKDVLESIG